MYENPDDLAIGDDFLDVTQKAQSENERSDKLNFI